MAKTTVLHVSYDFINNDEDELMLVMPRPDNVENADDENAKFVYDGTAKAMLVRNSDKIVYFPVLPENARNMIGTIDKLLVTEMDGEEIDDVYEATVEILNGPLPIPPPGREN